jgi:hypothetical protein
MASATFSNFIPFGNEKVKIFKFPNLPAFAEASAGEANQQIIKSTNHQII